MQMATLLAQVDFDFETTQLVTRAFYEACRVLDVPGGHSEEYSSYKRNFLAGRIIELALLGEKDEDRLIDGALDQFERHITGEPIGPIIRPENSS